MTYVEEQSILKRIEELEKHQKEQDERLKELENRTSFGNYLFDGYV